jgi:CheY-like chemotaxis protein
MPSLTSAAERDLLQREILGATRERMLREIAEALEALTAETPLALVLEDLHWSDYSTLDLISSLAQRPEPARLLLIGTYRPVEVILSGHPLKAVKQELQVHRQCEELSLEFLTEADVAAYVAARFPGSPPPPELAQVIHRRTDGNPLFMVNVVDYWVARGLLAQRDYQRARQEAVQVCELAAQPGERTYLALGRRALAEIAMAEQNWDQAEAELAPAQAVLEGVEAPLAEWRVYATAARFHQQRRRKAEANSYWARSAAVLHRLADSLGDADDLRQSLLSHPTVQAILRRAG